nr:NS3 [Swine acute diarrhea syndrome coronavirus]QID98961.1 NS3 [Swine acute diarrhea syndrome coronavirus]QID98970.1 NS3 [Swine acute diarrhea syndrome coronavirus]QID98977.1 NS3 [Swine acute diarrhea syndrome coronavirus]
MFGGLFQLTLEGVVNSTIRAAKLDPNDEAIIREQVQHAINGANMLGYMLTSMFVWYFALYKPSTRRGRIAMFVSKLLVIFAYVPIIAYCGGVVDSCIILVAVVSRLLYTSYYAFCYRSFAFVLFNAPTLCFINGTVCLYSRITKVADYIALYGGHHYVTIETTAVEFAHKDSLYVAIRGKKELNLYLSKAMELSDGAYIYLFTNTPFVGIYNANFQLQETQLNYVSEDC